MTPPLLPCPCWVKVPRPNLECLENGHQCLPTHTPKTQAPRPSPALETDWPHRGEEEVRWELVSVLSPRLSVPVAGGTRSRQLTPCYLGCNLFGAVHLTLGRLPQLPSSSPIRVSCLFFLSAWRKHKPTLTNSTDSEKLPTLGLSALWDYMSLGLALWVPEVKRRHLQLED